MVRSRQRIALNTFFFLSGLCFSTWASRIPDVKSNFDLSDSALGAILLVRPLGALVGLPLAGIMVDRYGSKRSAIAGIAAFGLSLLALGLAPSLPLLIAGLLCFGLAANLINISNNAQALIVQKSYGKVIMASFHGLWSLAGFFGAALGALALWLKLSISSHFMIISGVVFILLLISFQHLVEENGKPAGQKFVFRKPDKHLMKLGLIAFCGLLCEGCMFDWSGVYFKQVIQAEEAFIATGYMAFMGMMAFGRLISDKFTNRYGSRSIIQVSGVLIFSGLLLAVLIPNIVFGIVGFILVGAGTSSVIPLTYNEVGKTNTFPSGIALALVSTIGYFGFMLGPPLIGFVADIINLQASFTLVAIVGLTITVIVTTGFKKKQDRN